MKIQKLHVENFMRIRSVTITPDGNLVRLRGRNKQGKTSLLRAIEAALGGKKLHPAKPIREGASEAKVEVDLGDYLVEVIWTANDKATLTVRAPNGARYGKPQAVLDGFVGAISFDPLAFMSAEPKEQVEILKKLVGNADIFAAIAKQREALYVLRTDVNAELRRAGAKLHNSTAVANAPKDEVSVASLAAKLEEATAKNANREKLLRDWKFAQEHTKQCAAAVDRAQKALDAAHEALGQAVGNERAIEDTVRPLEGEINLAPLRKAISEVEEVNHNVRHNRNRLALVEEVIALEKKAAELTKAIDEQDAARAKAIAEAKLPVPGLAFSDDEGVSLGGLPLAQASHAEQVRISVAMGAALNPGLRALLVRQGAYLDADGWTALSALSEELDAQLWVEDVGRDGPGIVIEDGLVEAAPATTEHPDPVVALALRYTRDPAEAPKPADNAASSARAATASSKGQNGRGQAATRSAEPDGGLFGESTIPAQPVDTDAQVDGISADDASDALLTEDD